LIRTLPVLIYAAILSLAFGFGVFPGTVAIAIFTFGILSKMLYENIETIDLSAYDAIEATGATKSKSFIAAILPQIFPSYLSFSLYSFEINIRFAAILGYVGAGGIGILFDNRMAWRRYEDVAVLILMLFVVVLSIESLSRYFRKRLA
jgi:phosphonate transport system permease protein